MKITKTIKNEKTVWRVNDPHGPGGKRQRRFFNTADAAKDYARRRTEAVRAFGIHVATFTPEQCAEIGIQLGRLRRLGWTLRGAVDFVERHGKAPPAAQLSDVVRDFLNAKQITGLRPRYMDRLRVSLSRFLEGRKDVPISEITASDIREYISHNGWAPATARGYLGDVQTLFSWSIRNGYLRENAAAAVDKPRLEDRPPGIISPAQCARLMRACQEAEPTLLPTLVLCLFAGIRPEEARRLEWVNIGPEHIEIPGLKSKTRRRRLIPLTPQLRTWLETARAESGELPVANYATKFNRVRRLAGLFAGWPHDALRHSFASYHLAKHRNENETALLMGNSPQMLYAHYREVVRPADAEVFFGILPAASGEAAVPETAPDTIQRRPAAQAARNRGNRQVTIRAMSAVFANGAKTVPREEVFRQLCDVHGLSASTAFAALSPAGRFRDRLRVTEAGLEWISFPEIGNGEAAAVPPLSVPLEVPEVQAA